MSDNYFVTLNNINVNGKTEKKNGLTYLSWVWAWGEVKKLYPDATYTIYENANGLFYHTDGKTCWVKTGVTVNGIEHIEYLPVMDYKNQSIPLERVTSFDVNKAIQRSLTKAVARHGLGLYIYAGEDLPEDEKQKQDQKPEDEKQEQKFKQADIIYTCERCGKQISDTKNRSGEMWKAADVAKYSEGMFDAVLCPDCMKAAKKEKRDE